MQKFSPSDEMEVVALVGGLTLAGGVGWITSRIYRNQTYEFIQQPCIETDPRFKNEKLLSQAWQLPVARIYSRHPVQYQPRSGYCGPASANNVLLSIGKRLSPCSAKCIRHSFEVETAPCHMQLPSQLLFFSRSSKCFLF
jgi:hypothetical protein